MSDNSVDLNEGGNEINKVISDFIKMILSDNNDLSFSLKEFNNTLEITSEFDFKNVFWDIVPKIVNDIQGIPDPRHLCYCFNEAVQSFLDTFLKDFDLSFLSVIANENYEKKRLGHIFLTIVPYKYDNNKDIIIQYDSHNRLELKSQNTHGIRKQLEMVQKEHCLVVHFDNDRYSTLGIGIKKEFEKFITIEICNGALWKLTIPSNNKNAEIWFKNGAFVLPYIDDLNERRSTFQKQLEANAGNWLKVKKVIDKLKGLNKGTSVVFCNNAKCFRDNYIKGKKYGYALDGADALSVLNSISSIDGAIICDLFGACYGYGVILNFTVYSYGEMSRGSRYNSINNFVKRCEKTRKAYVCGVTISDDGMVNYFYPEPQL